MAPIKAMHAALALFSTMPVPALQSIDRKTAHGAVRALPWLGLLISMIWFVIFLVGSQLQLPAFIIATAMVAAAAGLTGSLHLDGLADVADGLGSRKPPAEALAIMKKSDIGPMGVASMLFVTLLQIGTLSTCIDEMLDEGNVRLAFAVLLGGPMIARLAVVWATRPEFPAARPGGFGSLVNGVTTRMDLAINTVAVGLLLMIFCLPADEAGAFLWAALAMLLALVWAWLWSRHLRRRFGGITGDCFGSIIETTQLAFTLAGALMLPLGAVWRVIH